MAGRTKQSYAAEIRSLKAEIRSLKDDVEWLRRINNERGADKFEAEQTAKTALAALEEGKHDLVNARMALHGMEVRAQRAEAIAEMLHAQLYPQPKLPWHRGGRASYQHVGNVGEFRFEE